MGLKRADTIGVIVITCLILIILIPIYVILREREESSIENRVESRKEIIANNIKARFDVTVRSLVHQNDILKNTVLIDSLDVLDKTTFDALTSIESYPAFETIQNIRYSPIVYRDEFEQHVEYGKRNIDPNYTMRDIISIDPPRVSDINPITLLAREFVIPIFNSAPVFRNPSFHGADLYEFFDTRPFFDSLASSKDSFAIEGPIEFFNSQTDTDGGVYIGSVVQNCQTQRYTTLLELVQAQSDKSCVKGFVYTAVLARDLVRTILKVVGTDRFMKEPELFSVIDHKKGVVYSPEREIKPGKDVVSLAVDLNSETRWNLHIPIVVSTLDISEETVNLYDIMFPIITLLMILIANGLYIFIAQRINLKEEKSEMIQLMIVYMNHELRNSVNLMIGYTDIVFKMLNRLRDEPLTEETQKKLYEIINKSRISNAVTMRARRLINDTISSYRLEQGELEIRNTEFRVKDITNEINTLFDSDIVDTEAEFRVECDCEDLKLTSDRDRTVQIVINLLTNAFKHTVRGSIVLRIKKEESELVFEVEDTGSGVSEEIQEKIFRERFIRIDRRVPGVGIGLYICKKIADLLKAHIEFETEIGVGSKFWLRVPISTHVDVS